MLEISYDDKRHAYMNRKVKERSFGCERQYNFLFSLEVFIGFIFFYRYVFLL